MKTYRLHIGLTQKAVLNQHCYKCEDQADRVAIICLDDSDGEMYMPYCKGHKEDVLDDATNEVGDDFERFFPIEED